jgi:uncharacterized membrane protein (DUF485 family)
MLMAWLIIAVALMVIGFVYVATEPREDQLMLVPVTIGVSLLWPLALLAMAYSTIVSVFMWRSTHVSEAERAARSTGKWRLPRP